MIDWEYMYHQAMDTIKDRDMGIQMLENTIESRDSLICELEEKVDQLNFDIEEQDSKLQNALGTIDSMLEDKQSLEAELNSEIKINEWYDERLQLAIQEIESLRNTKSIIGTKSIQLKGD